MVNGLDLFSGIGGLARALKPWVRTVAYCEIDRYCQHVLLSEMQRGRIDRAPVWDDVRTLRRDNIKEPISIISGGFPCQDISVAGAGKGLEGERSGLFFEIVRLIREFRPQFVFLENVPAITIRGLDTVTAELSALRYDCRWGMLSAYDMGAPHRRERWWMLAHACNGGHGEHVQQIKQRRSSPTANARSNGEVQSMANADGFGWNEGISGTELPTAELIRSCEEMANTNSERCEKWGGGVK